MRHYISEEKTLYYDYYHGLFSKRLAEWAISMMRVDKGTGSLERLIPISSDDVYDILKTNGVKLPEEYRYTAWYLFNMARADYKESLPTDAARSMYVKETLNDPDGESGDVLACFEAKMCNAGIPIFWERMI